MAKAYVYELVDPRDNAPRYVGQSIHWKRRLSQHKKDIEKDVGKWAAELQELELDIQIGILEETNDENVDKLERYWIKTYRDLGYPLLNKTDGGKWGVPGYTPPLEVRKRIAEGNKRQWEKATSETKAKMLSGLIVDGSTWRGKKLSEEHITKMSKAAKRRYAEQFIKGEHVGATAHTPEAKEKRKETMRARHGALPPWLISKEARAKMANTKRGQKRTEEFRQRLSQIMKEYYEEHPPTEESNRKRSEALMGHEVTEETRAKMAAHAKERADRGELDYLYTEELNQSRSKKITDVWATRNGMTPERKEELKKDHAVGMKYTELGRKYGIDRKTAARIVKEGA